MNLAASNVEWLPILIAALVVLVLVARFAKPAVPKFARKRFLSEVEMRVLGFLEAALPEHRVMAQVAMGALLSAPDPDRRKAHAARNRFSQKIVDFVVITRDSAEVVTLIELDDRTHSRAKDADRDAMTEAAGYRTIRIPGSPRPTADIVRSAVAHLAPVPATAMRLSERATGL